MEDMKERYYNLVNELNLARDTEVNMLAYDAEHERRRKEQLEKLLNRTEEQVERNGEQQRIVPLSLFLPQIKEEEELKEAVKRIETKRKDRERKAHDLQRLINATERVSVSPDRYNKFYSNQKIFYFLNHISINMKNIFNIELSKFIMNNLTCSPFNHHFQFDIWYSLFVYIWSYSSTFIEENGLRTIISCRTNNAGQ
jgi:hypothetical protein